MRIEFHQATRKFPGQIVFKNLNLKIEEGSKWAILGGNGSGKSTFLKTAYGALSLSEGEVSHHLKGQKISLQDAALKISYAAPYLELIEELSLQEFLNRYKDFRPFRSGVNAEFILEQTLLKEARKKKIRNLSSGMKQRLRLGLALFSAAELIILDEPTSNLDADGVQWYRNLLASELADRSLLIGTNYNEDEAFICDQSLRITDYQ